MTVCTRFHRITIATLLVLTLLIAPAFPAGADEVGSGWTGGIANLVGTWIANLGWPTQANADKDVREGVGSSGQTLKPAPGLDGGGEDIDHWEMRRSPVRLHVTEEHNCDGLPEADPLGQC